MKFFGKMMTLFAFLFGDNKFMQTKEKKDIVWIKAPPFIIYDEDKLDYLKESVEWINKQLNNILFYVVDTKDRYDIKITKTSNESCSAGSAAIRYKKNGIIQEVNIIIKKAEIKVIVHELLHAVGLAHDELENSIMYDKLKNRFLYMTGHDRKLLIEKYFK